VLKTDYSFTREDMLGQAKLVIRFPFPLAFLQVPQNLAFQILAKFSLLLSFF